MQVQNNNSLVSIIMPVYNREDYVCATIESICQQTYRNWELLIMDDGSEDDTEKVVLGLLENDQRISYRRFEHTGVTGKLKNAGLMQARGELICFMDSDDLWMPQKLEKQLEALSQNREAGYSFTNGYNFIDGTDKIEAYFYERKQGEVCDNFFVRVCSGEIGIRFPTLMIWKRILTEEHSFREIDAFSDFSFITDLAYAHEGVVIYDLLFGRRVHRTNSTSQGWVSDYIEHVETLKRYKQEGKLSSRVVNDILFNLYLSFGSEYIQRHMIKEGVKNYLTAWGYNKYSVLPFKKIVRSFLRV